MRHWYDLLTVYYNRRLSEIQVRSNVDSRIKVDNKAVKLDWVWFFDCLNWSHNLASMCTDMIVDLTQSVSYLWLYNYVGRPSTGNQDPRPVSVPFTTLFCYSPRVHQQSWNNTWLFAVTSTGVSEQPPAHFVVIELDSEQVPCPLLVLLVHNVLIV